MVWRCDVSVPGFKWASLDVIGKVRQGRLRAQAGSCRGAGAGFAGALLFFVSDSAVRVHLRSPPYG